MIRWICIAKIDEHPLHSNLMSAALYSKLKRQIQRTGHYEALVVRPITKGRYQLLNGHHRRRVLSELGHRRARCDIWPIGQTDALMLLATLNRLSGYDRAYLRSALVASLHERGTLGQLSKLLPETRGQLAKLLALQGPPPKPAAPPVRPL